MLELRVVRGYMAECLAQLVVWILPPTALPIALSMALPTAITVEGAREVAEIKSGHNKLVPSIIELIGMPSSMETASTRAKISRRLTVRKEGLGGVLGMSSKGVLMTADLMGERDIL
jgi:hypothetical protein